MTEKSLHSRHLTTASQGGQATFEKPADTPEIRWYSQSPAATLQTDGIGLAASDEFDAPPEASVDRSYLLPVPELYIRSEFKGVARIRTPLLSVECSEGW